MNTNEIIKQEIELTVEEMEIVIAPAVTSNHNETAEI